MKPMGLNSTPFLSYREIKTDGIDLFDDAWGFYPQFSDVIDVLKLIRPVPGRRLKHRLIWKIRRQN
jgi:hypothetical protein